MRIRSALAAVLLGVSLAAAGAASATAADGHRHHFGGGDDAICSPYFGGIDTSSSDIVWGGAHCEVDEDYGIND
ncbi:MULTISPECIES: hypothetical protein [unclassified Streptomyces]|uniref:hypothetical protein n=1 Tax=unclassified Streptomyces TaxID=2593676 RepID=UPI0037F35511